MYGGVIVAAEAYYPGTGIRIALQNTATEENGAGAAHYTGVWGIVVRNLNDGFCLSFVFESWIERRKLADFLEQIKKRSPCNEQ